MSIQGSSYTKGDWIVHARYGVGQVKGMEKKLIEGEKKLFYKVKTFNGASKVACDRVGNKKSRAWHGHRLVLDATGNAG